MSNFGQAAFSHEFSNLSLEKVAGPQNGMAQLSVPLYPRDKCQPIHVFPVGSQTDTQVVYQKTAFFVGTDPSNRISEGRRGAKHQEAIHMDHRDQMPQLFQCFVFKAIAGANGAVETWDDWPQDTTSEA